MLGNSIIQWRNRENGRSELKTDTCSERERERELTSD